MGQSPSSTRQVDLLDLAIATSNEEHVLIDTSADDTVRCKGHRGPVQLLTDAEDTHLTASRTGK